MMTIDILNPGADEAALRAALRNLVEFEEVDWFDADNIDLSGGTVDTTLGSYGVIAEGQSVIIAGPQTKDDAGIWVLGDISDPEAVPVTRRADSAVGARFVKRQRIPLVEANHPDSHAIVWTADDAYAPQNIAIIGTDIVHFTRVVQSGEYAVADGGSASTVNTASSTNDVVAGGSNNTASGGQSVVSGGTGNTASGVQSTVVGGASNTASDEGSTCMGIGNHATKACTVAAGNGSSARATLAEAFGAPKESTNGDFQRASYVLSAITANDTPKVATALRDAAAVDNQVVLPNNSAFAFTGTAVAHVVGGGDANKASMWTFKGLIKRGANAAATAIVGSPTITMEAQDAALAAADVALTADTTNGTLAVTVTGIAATDIYWMVRVDTVETFG